MLRALMPRRYEVRVALGSCVGDVPKGEEGAVQGRAADALITLVVREFVTGPDRSRHV
jgi:hypothetical protein